MVNVKRWMGSDIVETIVRIVVAITAIVCLVLFVRQNSLSSCQYEYNQQYAEFAQDSRDARAADDKARDDLFKAIYNSRSLEASQAEKQVDAAFVRYFTTIELSQEQRKLNPAPALPDSYCG